MMAKLRLFFILISIIVTSVAHAQVSSVTVSGIVKNKADKSVIPYVNIVVKNENDSVFVAGTV
ncbi:MAG: hypothetical protein Q8T08_08845, partial [Ignavibacteria bacterium]|nr:hypothetical protein [Ignavibacteria bacterium]